MKKKVWAWVCEYKDCGHVWVSRDDQEPRRCAGCKKPNWNNRPGTIAATPQPPSNPVSQIEKVPPEIDKELEKEPESPCGIVGHFGAAGKGPNKNLWYCVQCNEMFQMPKGVK